jgi:hypothetical protein
VAVGSAGTGGAPEPAWDRDRPSTGSGSSQLSFPDQARSGNEGQQPPAMEDADTDPAITRCDTDPRLSRIFDFGASSLRLAPRLRTLPMHPIVWVLTGGAIGVAGLAWLLRWVLTAP